MTSKEDRPLTLKQENFCQYYVDIEGNASEAYGLSLINICGCRR